MPHLGSNRSRQMRCWRLPPESALAPLAGNVVCLDMTPAMLSVGKAEAEKANLSNMTFVRGDAMELPFLDNSFDIVLSRLAFHYFPIQSNVCRALKPNGKLVLIDLEAVEESLRNTEDKIDRLRVPSHMRNLSRAEMLALYQTHDLPVECCEAVKPAVLQKWLGHTQTPQEVQMDIVRQMEREITGGEKTDFAPYYRDGKIRFDH